MAEVSGATLSRWGTLAPVSNTSALYRNQINLLAGVTRKLTPDFVVGALGGYETFDYRSDAVQSRLKGDGWPAGSIWAGDLRSSSASMPPSLIPA